MKNRKGNSQDKGKGAETEKIKVRFPRGEEAMGIIEQRVGGNRIIVNCFDGKIRNCRVPGRLRRSLWLRPGDVVIVSPWQFDKDKGDVIFKYNKGQVSWLKRKGYLKKDFLEF